MARTRSEVIDDIFVSTYQAALQGLREQVFDSRKSLMWALLRAKGGMKPKIGGESIPVNLEVGTNQGVYWVQKGESVPLNDYEFLEQARFYWRYATMPIVRFWKDDNENRGEAALFDMIEAKIKNSMMSFKEYLDALIFADNGTSTKLMPGFQHLIPDDPSESRIIGELNQQTYSWWRNQSIQYDVAAYVATPGSPIDSDWLSSGVEVMRLMIQNLQAKPDLIITSQHVHNLMADDILQYTQLPNPGPATDLGYIGNAPVFEGIPVVYDLNCGNKMYFLNFDYLNLRYSPDDFLSLTEWLPIVNQPKDRAAHITFAANWTVSDRRKLGVIYNLPEA